MGAYNRWAYRPRSVSLAGLHCTDRAGALARIRRQPKKSRTNAGWRGDGRGTVVALDQEPRTDTRTDQAAGAQVRVVHDRPMQQHIFLIAGHGTRQDSTVALTCSHGHQSLALARNSTATDTCMIKADHGKHAPIGGTASLQRSLASHKLGPPALGRVSSPSSSRPTSASDS